MFRPIEYILGKLNIKDDFRDLTREEMINHRLNYIRDEVEKRIESILDYDFSVSPENIAETDYMIDALSSYIDILEMVSDGNSGPEIEEHYRELGIIEQELRLYCQSHLSLFRVAGRFPTNHSQVMFPGIYRQLVNAGHLVRKSERLFPSLSFRKDDPLHDAGNYRL
jgi:hypothetical protein